MNKIYKYILIGIWICSIIFASCKADVYLSVWGNTENITNNDWDIYIEFWNNVNYTYDNWRYPDTIYTVNAITQQCNYSWYIQEDNINQNYCTSNWLCPIIDNSYCENNWLCTICWGSWEIDTWVNWSSLFLNGEQINGNAIIDIHYDNRLNNEIEYLNDVIDINITQNIDTWYIEQVKSNEKLTPTNEDITYMIQWLQVYIPYLFIGLIMIFTIALIRRFFR